VRGFLAIPKVLRNSATRQLMEKHRFAPAILSLPIQRGAF